MNHNKLTLVPTKLTWPAPPGLRTLPYDLAHIRRRARETDTVWFQTVKTMGRRP